MTTPFIEDNDQTRARREHLDKIRELVGNAYPNQFRRTNVAGAPEGEDIITALADYETIKRVVHDETFNGALDALAQKVKTGERPTPEDLEPVNTALSKIDVRVSGRLAVPPRVMGKAAFVHLSDGKSRLQIYVRRQEARAVSNDSGQAVEEEEGGWKLFQLLDHGDFIGVEGYLFVTKTGELSVHVRELQFLAKALVPMPDKMHGINDPEIRQRRRYADLIASSLKVKADDEVEAGADTQPVQRELTTREVFERRSRLITEMRRYLDDHGYMEVETPMLSPIASGAAARPFKTHHNALDINLYARIAPELYLKRLVVGGFERVYELNRNFRNEGVSTRHNPEFTMLEFYTAYKDVNWMMDFCEEMLRMTTKIVMGGARAQFGDEWVDFGRDFDRLSMKGAISRYWLSKLRTISNEHFEADEAWLDDPKMVRWLSHALQISRTVNVFQPLSADRSVEDARNSVFFDSWREVEESVKKFPESDEGETARHIAYIFSEVVEHHLTQPTFITDFPKLISPLSKASPDNPAIAERFELYIAGMEVANGFSELNDPYEQLERFEDQARQREGGDDEAMQMDLDYVRALSYGMPPAAGIGIGIDRLTMLLTNRRSIRDVILFPHMRPARRDEDATDEGHTETP